MANNNITPNTPDMFFAIGLADTLNGQLDTNTLKYALSPNAYQGFTENEVMHWACTYNIKGINHSDTTAILYKNGIVIAATKDKWPVSKIRSFWLGAHPFTVWWGPYRNLGYSTADGVYDNLKIWNYAKTDFTDRYLE